MIGASEHHAAQERGAHTRLHAVTHQCAVQPVWSAPGRATELGAAVLLLALRLHMSLAGKVALITGGSSGIGLVSNRPSACVVALRKQRKIGSSLPDRAGCVHGLTLTPCVGGP